MDATADTHIEVPSGDAPAKPRIRGTRVRVQDIVACYEFQGMPPDAIVAGYPQISLADVYAALAYYHDHRDEIRGQMKADDEFVAQFKAEYVRRHNGKDADAASLSP